MPLGALKVDIIVLQNAIIVIIAVRLARARVVAALKEVIVVHVYEPETFPPVASLMHPFAPSVFESNLG